MHAEALAQLAALRLAQGRTEEAVRLLAGYEDHPETVHAMAALHLARGEYGVASSILRRRLREVHEQSLGGVGLLELLAEAEIAQGAVEDGARRGQRLAELGSSVGSEPTVARGERAFGRALVTAGDLETAIPHLERALAAFGRLSMPLEVGRTRLLLARSLAQGQREAAIAEARSALTCFEELGAARDADEAAGFLRALGVKAARAGPRGVGLLTKRELEVLGLLGEGLSNPDIAQRLFISCKTVEHHVARVLCKLELSGRGEAAGYALRNLHAKRTSATK